MSALMLPFYNNIKLAISNFCHLSDIFTQKGLQAPAVFQKEKRSLLICFKNCLQVAIIGFPLFFIKNFCYEKNVQFLDR